MRRCINTSVVWGALRFVNLVVEEGGVVVWLERVTARVCDPFPELQKEQGNLVGAVKSQLSVSSSPPGVAKRRLPTRDSPVSGPRLTAIYPT